MKQQIWLFLLMICMWIGACSETATEKPADLVVLNGQILTVDNQFSIVEALAIRDGVFVSVGDSDDVLGLIGDQTRVIDASGRTVIPGLIESHVHATGAARGEVVQPFVQLHSIGEIQQWLRNQVARTTEGSWIRLPRVDVTRIQEGRIPDRAELDEAAPDHPAVFIWQYANHQIQVLNSAAIKAAGISKDTPAPEGGNIEVGANGEPTGVLENSGELTSRFLARPEVSNEEYLQSLEQLLRRYNEVGITSIFERGSNVAGYNSYRKLKEENRLPVRATITVRLSTDGTIEGTESAINALPVRHGDGDDWVRVGPLKVRMDGGILYGTAFMREPYGEEAIDFYGFNDPDHRGGVFFSREELTNIIHTGHRLGWQMSSHVTGDAGVDLVLDAVETANANLPDGDYRYTLIHAYFANQEAAERAARLGVAVDTQPAWYYKDADALVEFLKSDRIEKFIGLQVWQNAGVKVAINSDHMQGFDSIRSLNPYNPFLTMYTAVSRKTENGQVIGSEQRVSREDALRMMTIDTAWLSFDETRKGSIEVGKLGDFAILSDDFLTCDEEQIKNIRSELTVVGGEIMYSYTE